VFDEPTTIPLGRLTFLFGPNSAGKSAVEDGLALLCDALRIHAELGSKESGRWDWDHQLLWRYWRRINGSTDAFAPTLTLGLTATLEMAVAGSLAGFASASLEGPGNGELRLVPDFVCPLTTMVLTPTPWSGGRCLSWHWMAKTSCRIDDSRELAIDFSHPVLCHFRRPATLRHWQMSFRS